MKIQCFLLFLHNFKGQLGLCFSSSELFCQFVWRPLWSLHLHILKLLFHFSPKFFQVIVSGFQNFHSVFFNICLHLDETLYVKTLTENSKQNVN